MEQILERHGLQPSDLIVELTENTLLEDHSCTLQTIGRLHDLGVRLSMDDVGTGYSSLSYLRRLPITELKLDRSFVADLESAPMPPQALPAWMAEQGMNGAQQV